MLRKVHTTVMLIIFLSVNCTCWPKGKVASAQQTFRPGEQIEYKASSFPEKWERGIFVSLTPDGKQAIIRQKPSKFYPEGFQSAYPLLDIRPVRAQGQGSNSTTKADRPPAGEKNGDPIHPLNSADSKSTTASSSLMSQQEILSLLSTKFGTGNPYTNPRRLELLADVRKEIMRRGLNFHYLAIGDFANAIGKYGPQNEFISALNVNFGAPASIADLEGAWLISKVGGTTTLKKGNDTYQRQEYGGNAGSLKLNPSGTYEWDSPSGVIRGKWRKASFSEMDGIDKGGEGIVLQKAKSSQDWLVARRREDAPQGDGILIISLPDHNSRERATRR